MKNSTFCHRCLHWKSSGNGTKGKRRDGEGFNGTKLNLINYVVVRGEVCSFVLHASTPNLLRHSGMPLLRLPLAATRSTVKTLHYTLTSATYNLLSQQLKKFKSYVGGVVLHVRDTFTMRQRPSICSFVLFSIAQNFFGRCYQQRRFQTASNCF